MSANPTAVTSTPPDPDRISWTAYLGLGLAAAVLGVFTSIGVWLFNQAFNAINNLTFNTIGGALQPIGARTIALIPAAGGILVALIMKFGTKPDKLAAMAHIIDGVTEYGGRGHSPEAGNIHRRSPAGMKPLDRFLCPPFSGEFADGIWISGEMSSGCSGGPQRCHGKLVL